GPLQAALVALGYYLSNSPFLANLGFLVFIRPLMAGTVVGFIFGDPAGGAAIGGTINLIYLGFISAGGSQPGDIGLAGWLGTALALGAGLDRTTALALAAPLGLLGTFNFATRMSVDSVFAHWADSFAEKGDIAGVARMNWVPPQILLFLLSFPIVFLGALLGVPAVQGVFDWLNANAPWVLGWLFAVGGWLPALGIAINLRLLLRLETAPYFFLGFYAFAIGGLNLIVIGVIFLSLAVLHVYFTKGGFARATAR
ncbi:MAG: PTS sugar transporter subunit IIC, partial [Chloroflexi bacterium]|nr:PTS sugar transporter subunit IIC [Chloroflexota bacterium]